MRVERIDDPADARLADYRDLTDVALRRVREPEGGLYIAESAKVLGRALAAGHRPRSVLSAHKWLPHVERLLADRHDVPVYLVPDEVAEAVTGYAVHRGILAAMHRPVDRPIAEVLAGARGVRDRTAGERSGTPAPPPRRRRIAILENLVDHANVGSAFRNAAALGIDGVLLTPACADPLYRRAVKTSMGNVFRVPWARGPKMPEMLAALTADGYTTVAFTLSDDAITLDELVARDLPALAMIFGTEGDGVDPRTARQVDLRVKIPMAEGVDSLNVAAATAVAFYATR